MPHLRPFTADPIYCGTRFDMNEIELYITARVDLVLEVDATCWRHDLLKRFAHQINAYSRFEEDGSWILTKTIKCSGLADLKNITNFIQFIIPIFAKKVKTCRLRFDQFDYCYSLDDLEAGIPVWF